MATLRTRVAAEQEGLRILHEPVHDGCGPSRIKEDVVQALFVAMSVERFSLWRVEMT
jgi:hypothetical protein